MPLLKQTLRDGLAKTWGLNNAPYPVDAGSAAFLWQEALRAYLTGLVPPSTAIIPATVEFGKDILIASGNVPNGVVMIKLAFEKLAISTGVGMQPNFTATPPINFPISLIIEVGYDTTSREQGLDVWCDAIDAWFRTGIAINNQTAISTPWA